MLRGIAILLLLPLALPAAAASDADSKYEKLLAAAKSGQPVDWQALRFAYADSSGFEVFVMKSRETHKAMNEAFRAGDYARALVQANLIIDQNYLEIDAHAISEIANEKLGNSDEAKKQHSIVVGLVKSIRTGDGRTPETAFTVITVHEEYNVMRILGLRPQRQTLISYGGHHYDVHDVADKDGHGQKLYFQIDRVIAAEAALLHEKR
jgi:hypothetical protein